MLEFRKANMPRGEREILNANIKVNSDKLPTFHYDSAFFPISEYVEGLMPRVHEMLNPYRYEFTFKNSGELKYLKGEKTEGQVLVNKLKIPDFPDNIDLPEIITLNTPENNALTIGRFTFINKALTFQLPRFHTGRAAQEDMALAMVQASQIPEIKSLTEKLSDPEKEMFIIYLTREGHLTDWHTALYETHGINVPVTYAHVEHAKDTNPENDFGRIAKICPINFEGLHPEKARVLVIGDQTASGMQQVAVIEETLRHLKHKNGGDHLIDTICIVTPLGSIYGLTTIALYAASEGISTKFITSGAILSSNPPDRYFSPVLKKPNYIPDIKLSEINHLSYGEKAAGKACARCNWTASFIAPLHALDRSEEELSLYGSSNEEILEESKKITPNLIKDMGLSPNILIPLSTWKNAEKLDLLENLKSIG